MCSQHTGNSETEEMTKGYHKEVIKTPKERQENMDKMKEQLHEVHIVKGGPNLLWMDHQSTRGSKT